MVTCRVSVSVSVRNTVGGTSIVDRGRVSGVRVLHVTVQRRDISVWVKPIQPAGSVAVAVLNRSPSNGPRPYRLRLADVTTSSSSSSSSVSRYRVTEVFDGRFLGLFKPTDYIDVLVNPTGVYFITAVPAVTVCDDEL